jgi:hypothetical protein
MHLTVLTHARCRRFISKVFSVKKQPFCARTRCYSRTDLAQMQYLYLLLSYLSVSIKANALSDLSCEILETSFRATLSISQRCVCASVTH